jgi:dolichol-phosphate mannosyltransferase
MEPTPYLSVVVPFYNEQTNLPALYERLTATLQAIEPDYELLFVDDGSTDQTPELLDALQAGDPRVVVLRLSRNFGHQAAISAGLDHARGQGVVVMDGDLQDPPEVLDQFIVLWRSGQDVVYAVRTKRKEGWFRRFSYWLFYRVLRAVSELDIPLDSGDFCLMDRKVVEALRQLPERARFVRGLRTFVGFRQIGVEYERAARLSGESKYTFGKLLRLASDGLIDFSSYPLRLVTLLGFLSVVLAFVLGAWVVGDAILNQTTPRGWACTLVVVLFMGAIQLLSLGILGAYLRRIFLETKGRPAYIIEHIAGHVPEPRRRKRTRRSTDEASVGRQPAD